MKTNNRTVFNKRHVQYADYYYRNQYGGVSSVAHKHSHRGQPYLPDSIAFGWSKTMEQQALRLNIKDIWTPECRLTLTLTANKSLVFTGDKATSIWKDWCAGIFGKEKR